MSTYLRSNVESGWSRRNAEQLNTVFRSSAYPSSLPATLCFTPSNCSTTSFLLREEFWRTLVQKQSCPARCLTIKSTYVCCSDSTARCMRNIHHATAKSLAHRVPSSLDPVETCKERGYKFLALSTGKKITSRSWDVIPKPDSHGDCPRECVGQQLAGADDFHRQTQPYNWQHRWCQTPRCVFLWRRRWRNPRSGRCRAPWSVPRNGIGGTGHGRGSPGSWRASCPIDCRDWWFRHTNTRSTPCGDGDNNSQDRSPITDCTTSRDDILT